MAKKRKYTKSNSRGNTRKSKRMSNIDLTICILIVLSILLGFLIYTNSGVIGEAVSAEKDMETNSVIVNGELGRTHGEYTDTYTPSGNGTPIYHYLSPEATMFINTSLRLAYRLEGGVRKVCCEMTSGKFPMLEPGENTVKFRLMPEYTWEHTMPDGTVRQYKHTEQKLLVFDVTPNTRWL